MTTKRDLKVSILLTCVAYAVASSLHAQTSTWTNNSSGLWTDSGSWDNGSPNSALTNAIIDDGDSAITVTLDASRSVRDLTLGTNDVLDFNNNTSLTVAGDALNEGLIDISGTVSGTTLQFSSDSLLSGNGEVRMSGGNSTITNRLMTSGGATLTIGAGQTIRAIDKAGIGGNSGAFINNGQVIADGAGAATLGGTVLLIDPRSGVGTFENNGSLRAENGGTMVLTGLGGGSFSNTGGTIAALDGSEVQLTTNASVTGGTISTSGSGVIRVVTGQNVFLTDLTLAGNVISENNTDLGISGTITNTGTITMDAGPSFTDLEVQAGGATLTGGGSVILSGSNAGINTAVGGTRLTNTDNLIRGEGRLGQNFTAITNSVGGVIDADVSGGILTLDPVSEVSVTDSGPSFLNNGILRASNGGILRLTGLGNGAFTNNNLITALNGSEIQLTTGASVTGGTISTSGSGVIRALANQDVFIENLTLDGNVISENNTDFGISGTITNMGTITMDAGPSFTDLEVQAGGATLTGGGSVILSGFRAGINTAVGGTRLTNTDNLIRGEGRLGQNLTAITNSVGGVIDADVSGGILILDPVSEVSVADSGPSFLNNGILRASNGGILQLTGLGNGAFTNNNLITALNGSEIQLTTGASITGGTISTSGSGVIRALANQDVFIEDLTLDGTVISENNTDLGISGTITNLGTITMDAGPSFTDLEVQAGGATLNGGGSVILSGANAGINTSTGGTRLTNTDNLIRGEGRFGQNVTAITNSAEGVIHADVNGGTLTLDPVSEVSVTDAGPSFLNAGTLRASNGGSLVLTGSGSGSFTNPGTIEALDGGTVNSVLGAVLTNNAAGVLDGGTYRAVDGGAGASLTFLGSPVTTLAAATTVDLSGTNSTISFGGSALSDTLTDNGGTLRIRDGRTFANVSALSNTGTIDVRGGTFSAPGLTNSSSGEITGFGNVNVRPANAGAVEADGGTLAFSNGIAPSGSASSVTVNSGASLDVSSGAMDSGAAVLAHNGSDLNLGSNDFLVSSDYTNSNFGSGNSFDARANVSGSGEILATGDTAQAITGDGSSGTIAFGNVHVGSSVTKNYAVANTGTAGPALRGAIQTSVNGGNVTDSRIGGAGATAGNFGPVGSGSDTGNLGVTFNATSAGSLAGQTIHVENNFGNVAGSDIALSGAAYRLAAPDVAPSSVDFGIIHVGDTVSQSVSLSNTATADGFSEGLNASFVGGSAGITGLGSVSALGAGGTDSSSLSISVDTSGAGFVAGNAFLNVASDGAGTSGLGTTALGDIAIETMAQINNYAAADYLLLSGAAALTGDSASGFILDFGTVFQGASGPSVSLAVTNDVTGPADTLAGVFDVLSASGYSLGGFTVFSGITAGDSKDDLVVTLDTSSIGVIDSSVFLDPRSQNASGFDGALDRISLTVKGVVVVPEPSSSALVAIAFAMAMVRRKR